MSKVKEWIKKCEGYSSLPYHDTVDKITIGWGRNLDDNGISPDEAELMFENDFAKCISDLSRHAWYLVQPQNVKDAMINMCFNLGINRLLGFKKMIEALTNNDYTNASLEALNSKWAIQVGQRAKDIALMIRQGV